MEQEWISPLSHIGELKKTPENLGCKENWMLHGVTLPPQQERLFFFWPKENFD